MPYRVSKSSECPASKPWAVIKSASGEVVACHDSEESAQQQMRALYVSEPDTRSAGQSQALYGGDPTNTGKWAVVTVPWGMVPEPGYADLCYIGEPIELLRQLYRYRLYLARGGESLDYMAGVLASELHIDRTELDALITAGEMLSLPSAGWCNLAQSCLFGIGSEEWQTALG